jgi:hypothetical protein
LYVKKLYAQGIDSTESINSDKYFVSNAGWFQNNAVNMGLYNKAGSARWRWNGTYWAADKSIYSEVDVIAKGKITSLAESASDMRLKANIRPFDALAILNKYPLFAFDWNAQALEWNEQLINLQPHYGTSAQMVQQINPEFVSEHEGYLLVNYQKFIPLLMRGEQQLAERVAKLETENKYLQDEIKKLTQPETP